MLYADHVILRLAEWVVGSSLTGIPEAFQNGMLHLEVCEVTIWLCLTLAMHEHRFS